MHLLERLHLSLFSSHTHEHSNQPNERALILTMQSWLGDTTQALMNTAKRRDELHETSSRLASFFTWSGLGAGLAHELTPLLLGV